MPAGNGVLKADPFTERLAAARSANQRTVPAATGAGATEDDAFAGRLVDQMTKLDAAVDDDELGTGESESLVDEERDDNWDEGPDDEPEPDDEDDDPQGPEDAVDAVGNGEHVVVPGECISSIAKDAGHTWETIWNHADNSELREVRQEPNVLLPGDHVHVPELRLKREQGQTEMRHCFRRKGEPALLRLRILEEPDEQEIEDDDAFDEDAGEDALHAVVGGPSPEPKRQPDQPRANVPYVLVVDGRLHTGTTDEDGRLQVNIPGDARHGELTLEPGTPNETRVPVLLGHVDPLRETRGVKERLANLGYDGDTAGDGSSTQLEEDLLAFQQAQGLTETGEADDATRAKLREIHGS